MTGKQRRYLRALGNKLNSDIQIGKEGITENFISNLDNTLLKRELVKVRILNADKYYKSDLIDVLTEMGYEIVGEMGFTILIYRENKELENSIELPK